MSGGVQEGQEIRGHQGGEVAELLRLAIQKKADIETLRELMALKRQHEADEARKAYYDALASFKAETIRIVKDRQVNYQNRGSGGNTSYKHASLANIVGVVTPYLSKHNLTATWRTDHNGKITVTCRITHRQGHFEETRLCADPDQSGGKNSIQAMGSTVSYLERYTLMAMLGLATYDQDDDGASAGELIEQEKIIEIQDHLVALNWDEEMFCAFLGIAEITHMTAAHHKKAMGAINQRYKQRGGK